MTRSSALGASLLEALIGCAIITAGLLGTAQWQQRLRQAAELARQQASAVQLAREDLELLRSAAALGTSDIVSGTRTQAAAVGASSGHTVARSLSGTAAPGLTAVLLQVTWQDTRGMDRQLSLPGAISMQAPALALALGQSPAGRTATPRQGRHAAIPAGAVELPDGRSVFKPVNLGSTAWLFDRRSGRIVERCEDVPMSKATTQLTPDDLRACSPEDALLLAGRVRHALGPSPDASRANDAPLALAATLTLSSRGHPGPPQCLGESMRLMAGGTADQPRTLAAATSLDPASLGPATWADTGERWWQFHCAIPRAAAARRGASPVWSGRLQFAATGATIGTVVGSQRICRYSADTDSSGAIDRAAESPELLADVDDALTEQNFLVIDGTLACPSAAASAQAAGHLPWSHANPATVPHQP